MKDRITNSRLSEIVLAYGPESTDEMYSRVIGDSGDIGEDLHLAAAELLVVRDAQVRDAFNEVMSVLCCYEFEVHCSKVGSDGDACARRILDDPLRPCDACEAYSKYRHLLRKEG